MIDELLFCLLSCRSDQWSFARSQIVCVCVVCDLIDLFLDILLLHKVLVYRHGAAADYFLPVFGGVVVMDFVGWDHVSPNG